MVPRRAGTVARVAGFVLLAACASQGVPPGGPERHTPPRIVRMRPDTNAVGVRARDVSIKFDEVVSERPAAGGAASLGDLVLVSPRDRAPSVDWAGDRIVIRPRRGFRENTTYTVTLLPGLADLRGNVITTPTELTFSTGPAIPRTMIRGRVFDALTGTPDPRALVDARPTRDTAVEYIAAADSLGAFHMRGLPPDTFRVRGWVDGNGNRGLDPGEPFDSLTVVLRDTAVAELLVFRHDSTGPRLTSAGLTDSVTLAATFDAPLDPAQRLTPALFALTGPDSAAIPLRAVVAAPDTATRQRPAVDTVSERQPSAVLFPPRPGARRAAPQTPQPRPTRPLLYRTVRITLGAPLRPDTRYTLRASGIRSPTGFAASSERSFNTPRITAPGDTTRPVRSRR